MKNNTVRRLVFSAMIAAIYAALTLSMAPISFANMQLRIAEALCVLPYFFPEAVPGLFIGCLLSNIISPYGVLDMIFGSAATALAALCTMLLGRADGGIGRKLLACAPPVVANSVMVGDVLAISGSQNGSFGPLFALNAAQIAIGEVIIMYALGFPILLLFPKTKLFKAIQVKLT